MGFYTPFYKITAVYSQKGQIQKFIHNRCIVHKMIWIYAGEYVMDFFNLSDLKGQYPLGFLLLYDDFLVGEKSVLHR